MALIIAGYILTGFFKDYATQQFQHSLIVHLNQLTANFNPDSKGNPSISPALTDPRFDQPLSGLYWQIDSGPGSEVLRSRSLWDDQIELPTRPAISSGITSLQYSDPTIRSVLIVARTIKIEDQPNAQWTLLVAGNTSELEQTLQNWIFRLTLFLLLLFISLSFAAIGQVVISLRPLRSLEKAMHQLRVEPMGRLKGDFPREIQPLIDDLNRTLDQNEQVITRARAQAGDLAHALKTPLAVLTNASRTLLEQSDEQNKAFASLVAEQTSSMQRHINWRLKRARTATTTEASHGRIQIAPLLEQIGRVMKTIYHDRAIHFSSQYIPTHVYFKGETQDLQEILGNLLDNAFKWARSSVQCHVSIIDQQLIIAIEDDGPGLSESQRELVLQRGVRMDEKIPGSGLGLSIVQELVTLYGGVLTIEPSPLGGLRTTIRFKA